MALSFFSNVNSSDTATREESVRQISELIKSPSFIQDFVPYLSDPEIQANQTTVNSILIAVNEHLKILPVECYNSVLGLLIEGIPYLDHLSRYLCYMIPKGSIDVDNCICTLFNVVKRTQNTEYLKVINQLIKFINNEVNYKVFGEIYQFYMSNAGLASYFAKFMRRLLMKGSIQITEECVEFLVKNHSQEAFHQTSALFTYLVDHGFDTFYETVFKYVISLNFADMNDNNFRDAFKVLSALSHKDITETSPEFISNVIVRAAKLTDGDISDYTENPERFIGLNLTHKMGATFIQRMAASDYMRALISHDIDVLDILLSESQDPIDLEAKIYLMQTYVQTMSISDDLYENMFDTLTTPQPPYVVASVLMFLMYANRAVYRAGTISTSCFFICNWGDIVVRYAAAKLLSVGIKNEVDFNIAALVNVEELLPSLLNMTEVLHFDAPAKLMSTIICKVKTSEYSTPLIRHFLQLFHQEIDDEPLSSSYMSSISRLVAAYPKDSNEVNEVCPLLLEELVKIIVDHPTHASIPEIIDVAATLNQKITNPQQIQLDFISGIMKSIPDFSLLMEEFAKLVCPYLIYENSPIYADESLTSLLLQFLKYMFENSEEAEPVAYGLVIGSCFIMAHGMKYSEFVTQAIDLLLVKRKGSLFAACMYVLASAFIANPSETAALINQDIADLIIRLFPLNIAVAYREMKAGFIVLVFLSQYGHTAAIDVASNYVERLEELREIDCCLKDDKIFSMLHNIPLPIDSYDEFDLFSRAITFKQ